MTDPPPPHPLHRVNELHHVGHPALQQVADAGSTVQQVECLVDLDMGGEQDDRHPGKVGTYDSGCLESLGPVAGRHADVDDCQVRRETAHEIEELDSIAGLPDDGEPRFCRRLAMPSRSSTSSSASTTRFASSLMRWRQVPRIRAPDHYVLSVHGDPPVENSETSDAGTRSDVQFAGSIRSDCV